MTEETENNSQQASFESFASQALRLHRKGSFEMLLAQHLAVSVPSDPMIKVRLVCEAAYMVPQDKLSLDIQMVETIYMVALSFLNTNTFKTDSVIMAWSFEHTPEDFERFIRPWHRRIPLWLVSDCEDDRIKKQELLQKAACEAERFFLSASQLDLNVSCFQMLKSEFLTWAIPQCMEIFEKISRLIDPDLYREMLGLLKPEAKTGDLQP